VSNDLALLCGLTYFHVFPLILVGTNLRITRLHYLAIPAVRLRFISLHMCFKLELMIRNIQAGLSLTHLSQLAFAHLLSDLVSSTRTFFRYRIWWVFINPWSVIWRLFNIYTYGVLSSSNRPHVSYYSWLLSILILIFEIQRVISKYYSRIRLRTGFLVVSPGHLVLITIDSYCAYPSPSRRWRAFREWPRLFAISLSP